MNKRMCVLRLCERLSDCGFLGACVIFALIQSDNNIGLAGAKALVPALSEMRMLQSLNLSCELKCCVLRLKKVESE